VGDAHGTETIIDDSSIQPGVILMMVTAAGTSLYVVVIITIAAWRLLGRFLSADMAERDERVTSRPI
jgi:hypothetical protein